jgi:hypothetical protein
MTTFSGPKPIIDNQVSSGTLSISSPIQKVSGYDKIWAEATISGSVSGTINFQTCISDLGMTNIIPVTGSAADALPWTTISSYTVASANMPILFVSDDCPTFFRTHFEGHTSSTGSLNVNFIAKGSK